MGAGYRFHFENLPYYYKLNPASQRQKVLLRSGDVLIGVVTDAGTEKIKIDVQGAGLVFSKTEIESMQSVKGESPWQLFYENYEKQKKVHPLVTQDKAISIGAKVDYMMTEPSRIADQIRQEHPEVTGAGQQAAAMEALRAAQILARNQKERAAAEMEKMEQLS